MNIFNIRLCFNKFNNAEVMKKETSHGLVEGIFIPFRDNNIYKERTGDIAIYITMQPCKKPLYGFTHMLKVYATKSFKRHMIAKHLKLPIIGNAKAERKTYEGKRVTIDDIDI